MQPRPGRRGAPPAWSESYHSAPRRWLVPLVLLIVLIATAVTFYVVEERWSLLDALYMTVITLSTVGYREGGRLSPLGQVATMLFIISGLVLVALAARGVAEVLLRQELLDIWGQRRRQRAMERFSQHYIVCGYGRMGREIVRRLLSEGLPVVVVEKEPELTAKLEQEQVPLVSGDASDDESLLRAGIRRAKALVSVTSRDEDNLFITLSARQLNPSLYIVSRCSDQAARNKFLSAGASRVVSPYQTAARHMAAAVLHPTVADFLEAVTAVEERDLALEEIAVAAGSHLYGKTLAEAAIQENCGAVVVAIRAPDGRFHTNPPDNRPLSMGDTLIIMGTGEQLDGVERLCKRPVIREER